MNKTLTSVVLAGLIAAPALQAGVFMFAELEQNPDLVTYPPGYDGSQNAVTVSVCIDPDSENISELVIPVRNALTTWNQLDPVIANATRFDLELQHNEFDVESVLLHEVGHCIGVAHPNLASESGFPHGHDGRRFAKALRGPNNDYDIDEGSDGVIGSRTDERGDDINLGWFRIGANNPFLYESVIDANTHTTDLGQLPSGHKFVEIAGRQIHDLRGQPDGEAVMYQGIFNQETNRQIHPDDATMIRLAMTGLDRTQGTGNDFVLELVYEGIDDSCDITVTMEGSGFGSCGVQADFITWPNTDNMAITSGEITLGSTSTINWYFNDLLLDDDEIFHDRFEE